MSWISLFFRLGATVAASFAIMAASHAIAATGANQHLQDRFAKMDANKDGKIVLEEFRSAFPNMNEKAFVLIDVNGDGGIDQQEWAGFMEGHARDGMPPMHNQGAQMNNIPGDPLIPPMDSNDLPLMRPPGQ